MQCVPLIFALSLVTDYEERKTNKMQQLDVYY